MGNKHPHMRPKTDRKTVFGSSKKEVYRIPALFYNRDSKILMAFAEKRGTSDDTSSVALVMATGTLEKDETSDKVTTKWSEMKPVCEAHLDGYRPMNPCPVYEKTSKTLFLFFICVEGTFSEQWQRCWGCNKARLCYVTTNDAGQSWSDVTDLTDPLCEIKQWATFAVGPGHGLQTKTNRMIVPVYAYASSSCCCIGCFRSKPYALALYSDNKGETWRFGNMLENVSLECEMAEFIDDKNQSIIYCNARTLGCYREEAVSKNNGEDFSKVSYANKLEETVNGCQGSIVSFPAQGEAEDTEGNQNQSPNKWLLFTHPKRGSKRTDLEVYLNRSPGKENVSAWSKPWVINSGPSGYSDVAYIDDGCFACLMECGRESETEQIACMLFSYNDIKRKNPLT